jgi:tetratricopeptide (TPR) repeat protein
MKTVNFKILLTLVFAFVGLSASAQNDINFYSTRANEKLNLKDYQGALADYDIILGMAQKEGNNMAISSAYERRSVTYSFMKDYKSAIAELEKGLKFDQANEVSSSLSMMADYAKLLKDYESALKYLERAIVFDKENNLDENGLVYYDRGRLKIENLSKKEEGCADLKKSVEILTKNNPALIDVVQRKIDEYCK